MNEKFNIKNKYTVKARFNTNKNVAQELSYFYLPLIGVNAFSLYMFLLRESMNPSLVDKFIYSSRIIDYLNLTDDKIFEATLNLEKFGLIEVFQDEKIKSKIVYMIKEPLDYNEINKTKYLIPVLTKKIGKDNLVISNYFLNKTLFNKKGYKLLNNEILFETKKDYQNKSFVVDFTDLFSVFNSLKINYSSFWNKEIEEIIKSFIIFNKVKVVDIIRLFKYLLDNKIEFTSENIIKSFYSLNSKLKTKDIFSNKVDMLQNISPYELLSLTLERKLTSREKKVIENLQLKYKLKLGVINLLLDYSLIVNGGVIVPNYIYKIADTLINEGFSSFEKVMSYLKDSYKAKKQLEKINNVDKIENAKRKTNDIDSEKISEIEEFYDDDFWGNI